jgi:hypothetical protein
MFGERERGVCGSGEGAIELQPLPMAINRVDQPKELHQVWRTILVFWQAYRRQ